MPTEKKLFRSWVKALEDEDTPMSLPEFQARILMMAVDNQSVLEKRLQQIIGQLNRIEQFIISKSGEAYPQGNADPRPAFRIAREKIEQLDRTRFELIAAGGDPR